MARKYFPELGDVVSYKDKRVVIVHIENNCTAYPVYFYSFLDESLIHNYSFIETDELIKKCIRDFWIPRDEDEEPPFTKIDTYQYKIEYTTFTRIIK